MPREDFDARNVANLEAREGRSPDYWWDSSPSAPPGFGLRVTAGGERSFIVDYRHAGRSRRMTLGKVGVLSLANARTKARAELRKVADGADPQREKATAREAEDVAATVAAFIDATEADRAPKTITEYRRILRAEINGSRFGRALVRELSRPDVRAFLATIAERAPVMANRVYQLVRAAFAWAVSEEVLEHNPCEGLKRPRKEKTRDRVLTDAELRLVWAALDAEELDKATKTHRRLVPAIVAAAVRILLLLGTRRSETLRMRWQDVDLERREWVIPGEFRKGGEPLTVPLSAPAVSILQQLGERKAGPVFAGERGASIAANPGRIGAAMQEAVRKTAAKAKETVRPFTLHDLRRSCATGCGELGAPPHVVALVLGHQAMPGAGRVTGVYDRSRRVREVAPWLTAWGEHVARVVSGEKRGADVVPLVRA